MTHIASRRATKRLWPALAMMAASVAPLNLGGERAAYAADDPFESFPMIIHCKQKDTTHAFYLSRVTDAGVATYVASDRIAGTISLDGRAKAVGGEGGGNCVGKTLQDLRDSNQVYDLKPQ
ncbi:hypothetical protein [Rhizobium metallidurans]|uniref:Uncharacterized protein n=1 Tax=Rhizobium metallidurans TaxID=1265931 RepID=A0A7W6CUI7_9HYPH|nr:hypothetical protein [Rhizobium metallidurans]MBB3962646.1 hypothetical protein [Rhizobium metallidurans]